MPKELNLTPPLVEAQKMIADFLCSVTHAELDLKRLSQLIEVGQQEIERGMGNGKRLCVSAVIEKLTLTLKQMYNGTTKFD